MTSVRRTAWLVLVSVLGRAPGFIIPIIVGALFGAGLLTDAYFVAYGAVLLVAGTVGQAFEVAIVPFAAGALASDTSSAYFDRKAVKVGTGVGGLWVIVVAILFLATGDLKRLVLEFCIAFLPLTLAWGAAAVYSGALISVGRIGTATGSSLWRGAGGVVGLALAPASGGLWAVALGLGAGEIARLVWLRRMVRRTSLERGASAAAPVHPSFRMAAGSMVIAAGVGTLVPMIEKLLAAALEPGAVSHLEYAIRLLMVPSVLFDGALGPLLLSRLARDQAVAGVPPTLEAGRRSVLSGAAIALGTAAAIALLAPFVVSLVLGNGEFTASDETIVAGMLRVFAIGFAASMTALLIERIYVAAANNRLLAVLSIPRGALRIVTVVLLLPTMGLMAFPLGYAVGELCYLGLLLWRVPRR